MKLDFLDDLTDNGKYPHADPDKLLRLYDFDSHEAEQLKNFIDKEIISNQHELNLSTLDFVECINCTLTLKLSFQNVGINVPLDGKNFVCEVTREDYKTMSDIIENFTKDGKINGYNWLYDPNEDKVDLLFSPGGTW